MVDDQPARLLSYEAVLAGLDVECVRALSGEEALEKLLKEEFVVIVLDVNMPGMDGFEVARRVRQHPRLERTPIIFVTAVHGTEMDRLKGYEVGAIDYIAVPLVPEILRSKVAILVELHQRRSELRELNQALAEARTRMVHHHEEALAASEAQLKAIVEHPSDVTVLLEAERDTAGVIRNWVYRNANANALRYLGRSREQLLGRRITEVLGEHAERGMALCNRALETGQPIRYEAVWCGTDFLVTVFSGGGNWVVSSGVDISERKQMERELRAGRAEVTCVTENAEVNLAHCDRDSRFLFVNRTYARRFGKTPEELIGKRIDEVAGAAAYSALEPYVRRVLANERVEFEIEVPYETLRNRFVHCIYVPDRDESSGEVHGFVAAITDVTERRQLENKLREADRRKDDFLAMLAHELRNPVAPIASASEALARMFVEDEKGRELVSIVQRQVLNLSRLLDDLLDVARITQGRIQLRLEVVALEECIDLALETAGPLIRERRHQLTLGRTREKVFVSSDRVRLAQCLASLLTNAAKYTDVGGEIRIHPYIDAEHAVIEVTDSGVGMSADFLPQAFELFAQSDRTLDRAQGGLGIGLSVCRQLMEMQGGTVTARSAGLGQGATFTLRMPLAARLPERARAALRVASRQRILIVDDNRDAADALALLLELEGHEVKTVYSAEDALQVLAVFAPQLALLDIGLPGISGYELARRVREQAGRAVKLVAVSGYGQTEDRERSTQAGFDVHLVKPVVITDLKRVLIRD